MTALSRLAFLVSLLASLALVEACAPWYVKYGINFDTELSSQGAVPKILPALAGDSCADVEEAAQTIQALAPQQEEVAAALAKALDGECGEAAGEALVKALASTGSSGFAALKTMLARPEADKRLLATTGLGELKDPPAEAVDLLAQKTASKDPVDQETVRPEAFASLIRLGTKAKGALPTLLRLLADEEWKWSALSAIDGIGVPDPAVIKALQVLLESEPAESIRPVYDKFMLLAATQPSESVGAEPAKPSPKAAAPKNVIMAVFDVQDSSGAVDPRTLDALTLYLTTQMTQVAGYRVVPREQLRARLADEKSGSFKQCFDESCQIELGKALAAQKTLATQLLKVGTRCMVVSNMFDLKTETSEKSASAETDCSENQLIDALRAVAQQYAE
jgi:hypothetical protein